MKKDDEFFMNLAILEAKKAKKIDEVPVGCVIVKDGEVISRGHNLQITNNNPTAHAEIIALQKAGEKLQNHRLIETSLYVTLEPCAMCFGAIIHARISKVIFATKDFKTGACGSCLDLANSTCFNHKVTIVSGILKIEAKELLQKFFKQKRLYKRNI